MRRGNSARQIVRTRTRRPRLSRIQTNQAAEMNSAAPSEVSEKCEPSERNSFPSWPKKNETPAQRSKGCSRSRANGPMS